jgi:hypothetical protein
VAAQRPGLLIPFALIFVSGRTIQFLAGLVLLAIVVGMVDRDWGLSSEARPLALERQIRFGPRAESRPSQKIIMVVILAMSDLPDQEGTET